MAYTAVDLQRLRLRTELLLGRKTKSDAQDRYDFMEQCISELEDSGLDDAEQICMMLWDEQGGD